VIGPSKWPGPPQIIENLPVSFWTSTAVSYFDTQASTTVSPFDGPNHRIVPCIAASKTNGTLGVWPYGRTPSDMEIAVSRCFTTNESTTWNTLASAPGLFLQSWAKKM
jgi:hypothetical protein